MKIIGIGDRKVIIEASNEEYANLKGKYSYYSEDKTSRIGEEFPIHEMYNELKDIHDIKNTVKETVNRLNKLASSLSIPGKLLKISDNLCMK